MQDISYTSLKEASGFLDSEEEEEEELDVGTVKENSKFSLWIWMLLLKQTGLNIKRAKVQYFLGFMACFLVVFVVAILMTLIARTPIIFLRLSENDKGDRDMVVKPSLNTGYEKINVTMINDILDNHEIQRHTTSRLSFYSPILKPGSCTVDIVAEPEWAYKHANESYHPCESNTAVMCIDVNCPGTYFMDASIYGIDFEKEKELLIGRQWELNDKLKEGEAYISSPLANDLNISIGDIVWARWVLSDFVGNITWKGIMSEASGGDDLSDEELVNSQILFSPFKIVNLFSEWQGKLSGSYDRFFLVDYAQTLTYVSKFTNQKYVPPEKRYLISSIRVEEYGSNEIFQFESPRADPYISSDFVDIQNTVVKFASQYLYPIGYHQVEVNFPVLSGLSNIRMISIFLGLILNIVIFILLLLSIVLIYSLLMISVETRTLELGIFRMLGYTRTRIIALLMIQAFSYSIPAWIMGLIIASLANLGISNGLNSLLGTNIGTNLSGASIGYATLLGFIVPLASSILPIRNALTLNLQDSLDTKHSKTKAVVFKIERADAFNSISWPMVTVGVFLILFGGSIYYLLPQALLSSNFALLMNIFLFILIGMLLGLLLLALNFVYLLEYFFTQMLFFWENKAIRTIILKNLVAHKLRNQKTSIMYSLSLGFIIFLSVSYNTQIDSLVFQKQQSYGTSVAVSGGWVDPVLGEIYGLKDKDCYESVAFQSQAVQSHTWVTFPIRDSFLKAVEAKIYNMGKTYSYIQNVYGVSPNYFRTTIENFIKVDSKIKNIPDVSLTDALYTENSAAIIGSAYNTLLGIGVNDTFVLEMTCMGPSNEVIVNNYIFRAIATLSSAPGMRLSSFPLDRTQDLMISFTTFYQMLKDCKTNHTTIDQIPMSSIKFKVDDKADEKALNQLIQGLKNCPESNHLEVWDHRNFKKQFKVASLGMGYFFGFTTFIAMSISFFSLMSSMYSNIHEQTKEIGILRALGVKKGWIYRIYIYEAFILILSSSVLGAIIGAITAFTMSAQIALFTRAAIGFVFPWVLMFFVVILSFLLATLSSCSPTKRVLRKKIVQIFKM